MRFSLWSSGSGPGIVAGPSLRTNIVVTNGVFAIPLDFGPGVFNSQPRWLEIDVRTNVVGTYETLSPRQALLPTPYAIYAGVASNVVTGSVVTSLNALKDNVTLAAGANLTITPSGNTLTLSAAGAGGSGIWAVNNNNAYYTAGGVGIGTSTPNGPLHVHSGGSVAPLFLSTGSGPEGAARFLIQADSGLFQQGRSLVIYDDVAAQYRMVVNGNGNVGFGTTTPNAKLEVVSGIGDMMHLVAYEPFITFYDSNHGYNRNALQSVDGSFNIFTEAYLRGLDPFGYIHLDKSGKVGIGSATPVSKLDIVGQDALGLFGYQPFLTLWDSNAGYTRSRIQGVAGDVALETERYVATGDPAQGIIVLKSGSGNVGIGTGNPQAKLDVIGNIRTTSLTILGGADLAEPFPMDSSIEKGSVMVIDHLNPGRLKLSDRAYDKRVAGIVSGANGINPGIALKQEGLLDRGENIALSGRVYVLADAANGSIEPGDLLTTSDTPGRAMKAADPAKAHGAILGKAMSALDQGQGMVLVLVTLH